MSDVTTQMSNEAFYDSLTSDDPAMVKSASDAVNDFTRTKMREDGIARRVLPPLPISDDELDRSVDTDKPVKIVDKEPNSPAAISVPFATNPEEEYIHGPRYRVMFQRILTPNFKKDVDELRTYHMDIRQVLSDNAIKDMLAEEDTKFFAAVNIILGAAGSTVGDTGTVQHVNYSAGITRDSLAESRKILPSTPNSLEGKTMVLNHVTVKDVEKFQRDEVGGDLAQDMFLNGYGEQELFGQRVVISIKKDVIATDSIYYFAEPKFLGKFYTLEDTTMFLEKRAFWIEFFAYESVGAAIGNVAAVARANFNVTGSS